MKVAVAPVGSPDADSEMALLKPPNTVVVMVVVPEAPCAAETEVGEAEIEKSGVDAAQLLASAPTSTEPTPVTSS